MKAETTTGAGSSAMADSGWFGLETASSWILGFGLILFLAVNGGGFGIAVFGQVGIFAWLILLLGVLLGLMPICRQDRSTWAGIGLLVALTAWALLGLIWTDSPDKTLVEVARLSTYTAIFSLSLASRGRSRIDHQIGAVATAIMVIALLGLLSRYFPGLFSEAGATGRVLTSEAPRLTFPLDYWNGLGALLALGIPLVAQVAGGGRRLPIRIAATAALPLIFLALYLTLSRGGLLAAAAALLVFHLLTRRMAGLALSGAGLVGGLALIELAKARPAFLHGLTNDSAHSEGIQMFLLSILVCALTALAGWGLIRLLKRPLPPRLPDPGRRTGTGTAIVAGVLAAVFAAFILIGGPGRTADAWDSFKSSGTPSQGESRLGTTSGNGRYQLWSSGLRQFQSNPVIGEGAGTFEYWWAERGDRNGFVRDAHSLYIQTLGESGLIGFLLLASFLLLVLVVGFRRHLLLTRDRAEWRAAAVAGCLAFMISVAFDWIWQIPVIVAAFMLLAATILASASTPNEPAPTDPTGVQKEDPALAAVAGVRMALHRRRRRRLPDRITLGVLAILGVSVLAVPVSSRLLINESQSQVRAGDLPAALDSAGTAHEISPGTAAPLIQEAGVLSLAGETGRAIERTRRATELEPVNWRNWYLLSKLEDEAGRSEAAKSSLEQARKLNPRSPLFKD